MGNFLTQPDVKKTIDTFDFYGKTGAVVSMQGWRVSMEVCLCNYSIIDRMLMLPNLRFPGYLGVVSLVFLMDMEEQLHQTTGSEQSRYVML